MMRHYAIIGGTSGMGLGLARKLVARGDSVLIGARNRDRIDRTVSELGSLAVGKPVDASDRKALAGFFADQPPITGLFVPGASYEPTSFRAGDQARAERLFSAKFWAQYWTVHAALPYLAADASVLLVSGSASVRPMGSPVYAACNAALEGLARALARELAPVRVNCLSPGMIDTELWRDRPEKLRKPMLDKWAEVSLVKRPGMTQEAVDTACFLLDNGNMTAATLYCDGGFTMR